MKKVFLTGTAHLQHLNLEIIERINNIIKLNIHILIGNYRGFDQLALQYLRLVGYPHVTVYETGSKLDFGYQIVNVGKYPAQDIEMSQQANWMLAVYDGKSRGVAANIKRMPLQKIVIINV